MCAGRVKHPGIDLVAIHIDKMCWESETPWDRSCSYILSYRPKCAWRVKHRGIDLVAIVIKADVCWESETPWDRPCSYSHTGQYVLGE